MLSNWINYKCSDKNQTINLSVKNNKFIDKKIILSVEITSKDINKNKTRLKDLNHVNLWFYHLLIWVHVVSQSSKIGQKLLNYKF